MPIITIKATGKTVEAAEGSNLLEVLLSHIDTLKHKCGDKQECGTCHISIIEGFKTLPKIKREENAVLDGTVGVGSTSRLACQVILGSENITVDMPK